MPVEGPAASALSLDAWAKVNLTLHITGRRPDGYHELDSLVVFARIGDTLEIAPDAGLSLSRDGPFAAGLGDPDSDLVLRAARALQTRFGVKAGARLHLIKRLPVAAGLGGGSADAAAALRGLNAFWSLGAAEADLRGIAATLGADVPVCLYGRPGYVSGIGEHIEPAPPLPPVWLVLVNPGVVLATPAVFEARGGPFSKPLRWAGAPGDARALALRLGEGRNDLEGPAIGLVPAIGQVLAVLRAAPEGLLARMSGSGATCFAMFEAEAPARAAAGRITEAYPDWWVCAAPLVRD